METTIEIKEKIVDGIMIFEFFGELDETNADKYFKLIYERIGDYAGKKVIFNLSGLNYLNSKSIGYIADIYSNIEEGNGKMYISNCTDSVKDVLELVGIISIIPNVATEDEAIRAIRG